MRYSTLYIAIMYCGHAILQNVVSAFEAGLTVMLVKSEKDIQILHLDMYCFFILCTFSGFVIKGPIFLSFTHHPNYSTCIVGPCIARIRRKIHQ